MKASELTPSTGNVTFVGLGVMLSVPEPEVGVGVRDRPGKRAAPAASPSGAAGAGCVTMRGTVRVCGPRGRPPGRHLGIPLPPISPLCPNLLSSGPRGDRGRERERFLPRRLCLAPCPPPPPGLSAAEPVASAPPDWALPGPGGQARPWLALSPPLLPWAPSRTAESRTGWCVTQASTVCPPDPHTWGTREGGLKKRGWRRRAWGQTARPSSTVGPQATQLCP